MAGAVPRRAATALTSLAPRTSLTPRTSMTPRAPAVTALRAFSTSPPRGAARVFDALRFQGLGIKEGGKRLPDVDPECLRGRVVLLTNTASYCGYTPQLGKLQEVYARYSGQGFTAIAAPSNDFGGQEPDDEPKIHATYTGEPHRVAFFITSKVGVLPGPAQHPVFRDIARHYGDAGSPSWNFAKFLFGRNGELVAIFPPAMDPTSPDVLGAIEDALKEPAPAAAAAAAVPPPVRKHTDLE